MRLHAALFTIAFCAPLLASSARAACPTPGSVSGFVPPAYKSPLMENSCDSTQISDYYTSCLGTNATQQACTTWTQANAACGSCLSTARNAAQWGALIEGNGIVSLNIGGCADIQGNLGCAKAYEIADACLSLACDAVCPVTDQASFTLYQQCITSASSGGCASYTQSRNAACDADTGTLGLCFGLQTFQQGYAQLAPMFCSTGAGDAGADSGSDDASAFDSGSKTDSGPKDAGKSDGSTGAEVDDGFGKKAGCHCDTVGSTGEAGGESGFSAMLGLFVVALARRRVTRKR